MKDLRHQRGQEESPCHQVGHRKEGEGGRKVGGRMGLAPLREAGGGERFLHSEGSTHGVGIHWDEEGPSGDWGIRGEHGQHLPCHLSPGKPPGVLGLNPSPAPSGQSDPGPKHPR